MQSHIPLISTAIIALTSSAVPALASISYGAAGSTYSESFDGLSAAASTTNTAFTNDSTIAGFYAFHSNATTGGDGGIRRNQADSLAFVPVDSYQSPPLTASSRVYSYGSNGDSDRAFGGSTGSTVRNATNQTTPGDFYYAFVIQNTTGNALSSFAVSYAGEQWSIGANITTSPQTLRLDYLTTSSFLPNAIATSSDFGSFVAPDGLSFASPQNAVKAAELLNGNSDANRSVVSGAVDLDWLANDFLILRFFDDDSTGNDHGLAIDDFAFSADSNVPEPAGVGLLVLAGAFLARRRRQAN